MLTKNYFLQSFKFFLAIILLSLFFISANQVKAEDKGLCTLSPDSCSSLTSLIDCTGNSDCFWYNYPGSTKYLCAKSNNKCLIKDRAACLAALSQGCTWKNTPVELPNIERFELETSAAKAYTVFPKLTNPLESSESPQALIGKIINVVMGLVGSLALIMFIFGGISWMTAGGNEEKIRKSIGMIVWSMLGLATIFLSYALVKFLLNNVI